MNAKQYIPIASQYMAAGIALPLLILGPMAYCSFHGQTNAMIATCCIVGLFAALQSKGSYSAKGQYFAELIVRATLIFLAFQAFTWIQFRPLNASTVDLLAIQDLRFNELTDHQRQSLLLGNFPQINQLLSILALASAVLLLTHKTARLGMLTFLGYFALNQSLHANTECIDELHQLVAGAVMLCLVPSMINIYKSITTSDSVSFVKHPFVNRSHGYHVFTMLKFVVFVGFLVSAQNSGVHYKRYSSKNANSPIKGTWKITEINATVGEKDFQTIDFFNNAQKIYLADSSIGKLQHKDTLSNFNFMIDPNTNQMEFWNFEDFRRIDIKGKYTFVADDKVQFNGRNEKDIISFLLVLEDPLPQR